MDNTTDTTAAATSTAPQGFDRAAYHAAAASGERVSFHSLLDFARNGKDYHARCMGEIPPIPETREMFFGTAAHTFILEGREKFEAEYKVADGPVNPRTGAPYGRETKAFAEWLATQDKAVVSTEEAALILKMAAAVQSHGIASQLLAQGQAETPVLFDYRGMACQSLIDWISPRGIVDLKTTADLDRFVFQARDARYIAQLAFYRRAWAIETFADLDCYIIAVEKTSRPRCAVYAIPRADLDEAEEWCWHQLDALCEAREADIWRDYYEELRTLTLHNY